MAHNLIYPSDRSYVTDYAVCLPLAETLGRSAAFAVDHEGDRGPEAMREWLDAFGLDWATDIDPAGPEWRVNRSHSVEVSAPFALTVPDGTDWYDAFVTLSGRRASTYGGQAERRTYGLYRAARQAIRSAMPHANGFDLYNITDVNWDADTHTYHGTVSLSQNVAAMGTVRALTESEAIESADLTSDCRWCDHGPIVDRVRATNAMRQSLTVHVPWGWAVRVGQGTLTESSNTYAYELSDDSDDAVSAIADAWDEGGAAAVAAGVGIDIGAAISTDLWLSMIRDTARSYEWCAEHHALITRVTHGTRQPYGEQITGEWSATITLDDGGFVSQWHGREDMRAPDTYDIERAIESTMSDHYGVSVSVTVEGDASVEDEDVPAHRSAAWVQA